MNWFILVIAGALEVVWAIGLKQSAGFTKLTPTLITLAAMGVSFYLLSMAMRTIPLGAAYAVWVGIGAIGAAIAGIFLFDEAATPLKLASLALVIAGIIGLKIASAG